MSTPVPPRAEGKYRVIGPHEVLGKKKDELVLGPSMTALQAAQLVGSGNLEPVAEEPPAAVPPPPPVEQPKLAERPVDSDTTNGKE